MTRQHKVNCKLFVTLAAPSAILQTECPRAQQPLQEAFQAIARPACTVTKHQPKLDTKSMRAVDCSATTLMCTLPAALTLLLVPW